MCVVDQDGEFLPLVHRLETPRDAHARFERPSRRLQLAAERGRRRECPQGVGDVEAARQRQRQLALCAGRVQREAALADMAANIARAEVRGGIHREGDRPLDLARQLPPIGVADVEHARARGWRGRAFGSRGHK